MTIQFHVTDLIPAYALDCLDEDEVAAVREHLADCALCRAELRSYQAVTEELAYAAPQLDPPERVKSTLMGRVQASAGVKPEVDRRFPEEASGASGWLQFVGGQIRSLGSVRLGSAWALVALVVVLALVASNILLWRQVNALHASSRETAMRVVALQGTEAAPEATGLIVVSLDGRHGTMVVDHLPQLDEAHQYQLWLIKDGQRASGAVFSVSEDGYGSKWVGSPEPLADYTSFGVTVEPEGGSPGPTGEKVLGGDF
jgi:anti-sigma-K factor RskA